MRALRVCFVITEDWYFWSHRRILAQYLVQRGCRVDVVTNLGKLKQQIESAGMIPHSVGLQRRGRNPFDEAGVVARMASLFRRIKPDLVHLVGMKPILYGSLAARIARVPATVCAIAGLGWLFTPGSFLKSTARRVVQTYFRRALSGRSHIRLLVQNTHHRDLLTATRMAKLEQIELVHGAGVDTDRFRVRREPDGDPVVVTHARMLWDKGIGELVEAARMVRRKSNCRFLLVGDPDPANPASIPRSQLEEWNSEGAVEWHGRRNDIPEQLANAHLACLPSYHEGFPLSLVEAASSGRAIVTTDIPGCRDVVEHEENGLLVPRKDPVALAAAISRVIEQPDLRREMGRNGRLRVLDRMSCDKVNRQTYSCYENVLGGITLPEIEAVPARETKRKAA